MRTNQHESLSLLLLDKLDKGTLYPWIAKNFSHHAPFPPKPRVLLPEGRALKTSASLVEFMGFSRPGKSNILSELHSKPIPNTQQIIQQEFQLKSVPDSRPNGAHYRQLAKELGGGGLAFENLILETLKLLTWHTLVDRVIGYMIDNFTSHQRGDPSWYDRTRTKRRLSHLAWISWLKQINYSRLRSHHSDYFRPYKSDWDELFLKALIEAEHVDVVIFFWLTQSTTESRRVSEGEPPEGRVVNRATREAYEYGFSWWLGSIFPWLRKIHGTGLLIVNGEEPALENYQRVVRFINQVVLLKNPNLEKS